MSRVLPLCALLMTACYPKSAVVPDPVVGQESGRALFAGNCNRCHRYPDVNAFTAEHWPKSVHRMAHKAHLGPEEEHKILEFVLAARNKS